MAPSKTSTRRRPRISAVATRADATVPEQLHAIARAGFASIAGSEGVWHLFPNGIGLVELKATAEGAELFLRLAGPRSDSHSPAEVASAIRKSPRIQLLDSHSSGNVDDATALDNITDTSNGKDAKRSSYGSAPGGTTPLKLSMLEGLLGLSTIYTIGVSEVAGGEHSPNSRHYAGVAFDSFKINGKRVDTNHPDVNRFMQDAKSAGATEVLGPGDPGHDTHIHTAWPRQGPLMEETNDVWC